MGINDTDLVAVDEALCDKVLVDERSISRVRIRGKDEQGVRKRDAATEHVVEGRNSRGRY